MGERLIYMKNEKNKGYFNSFKKVLTKRKSLTTKAAIAVFCVAILLISGFSAALFTQDIFKKETRDSQKENRSMNNFIFENGIGNTGYESWYHYIGDIINSANGNLYLKMKDITINALGFDIEIIRSYNSYMSNINTGFGYGWTFNYNTHLSDFGDYVLWVDGDGSVHNFTDAGLGNYDSPSGIRSRLNKNPDDSFTLWLRAGEQYNFDSSGILQTITDKNGNKLTMTYSAGKLEQIDDDSGLCITIDYDDDLISSIADPMLGRQITYSYDEDGNLVGVIDAMENVTQYSYWTGSHYLCSVMDREGKADTESHISNNSEHTMLTINHF